MPPTLGKRSNNCYQSERKKHDLFPGSTNLFIIFKREMFCYSDMKELHFVKAKPVRTNITSVRNLVPRTFEIVAAGISI